MIDPESLQVGQAYLIDGNIVRRAVRILPDGRVQYEWRGGVRSRWKSGIVSKREFAAAVERPVPDDWIPESDKT
jgi:hypothetical protein